MVIDLGKGFRERRKLKLKQPGIEKIGVLKQPGTESID
jgi:hypothetical protein